MWKEKKTLDYKGGIFFFSVGQRRADAIRRGVDASVTRFIMTFMTMGEWRWAKWTFKVRTNESFSLVFP